MILSHQIRLEPTFKQAQFLSRCAGTHRFAWNWALAESKRLYAETGKSANMNELKKRWNASKPDWVYDVPKDCNQQPFTDLGKAYSCFFKGLKGKRKVGHPRISNVRKDTLHKATTKLCRENQTIVLEDLHVAGMLRNRKLSRAISDVGLYEFRRQLEYKSKLYRTEVVIADRFFPSSKTCSSCGVVKESLTLSERTWVCMSCGTEHDRDLNAAMNLRTLGLRGTSGVCPETLVDKKTAARGKYSKASRLVEARSTTCAQANACEHKV